MKLSTFIRNHKDEISEEWIKYAKENLEPTHTMDLIQIRDHIMEILDRIAEDMDSNQTDSEKELKSRGNKILDAGEIEAAIAHGEQRVAFGFDILQLSSEFRALRASVLRLWEKKSREEDWKNDFHDMIRFNEAIDEVWMISVQRFQEKLDQSKNWFLGILGHDLRNPLTTISAANSILNLSENLSEREKSVLKHSSASIKRMTELINNLLELTELRLGKGLEIQKQESNLTDLLKEIVREMQMSYPDGRIILDSEEDVVGEWDGLRLEQMITNLIANALRHGSANGVVDIKLSHTENNARISIHNEGPAIPEDIREKIFVGKFSGNNNNESSSHEKSYGLGLFIVKEIVDGHKGTIELSSNEEEGTTFAVILPKQ